MQYLIMMRTYNASKETCIMHYSYPSSRYISVNYLDFNFSHGDMLNIKRFHIIIIAIIFCVSVLNYML